MLTSAACYPTYERGSAAAAARDWPKAESELWRFIQGPDCYGRDAAFQGPTLQCKQAFATLGEVLLEDDRPFQAAMTSRSGRDLFYKKQVGDPATSRDLDKRIAANLVGAKKRWDQFRAGGDGQCRIIARYAGPGSGYQLRFLWTELDLGQATRVATAVDGAPLFDSTAETGPHAITIHAAYTAASRPGQGYGIETTYFRSCTSTEQIEVLFQIRESRPEYLSVDPTARSGSELAREGPLRTGGIPPGPSGWPGWAP